MYESEYYILVFCCISWAFNICIYFFPRILVTETGFGLVFGFINRL
jgi:hypothetical protein